MTTTYKHGTWYPIETAPKDGSKILLCSQRWISSSGKEHNSSPRIIIGYWREANQSIVIPVSKERRSFHNKHGGYWTSHFKGLQPLKGLPSFWMPLPEPPADNARKEDV